MSAPAAEAQDIERVKAELALASYDLLAWPRDLPGGARIPRPEVEALLARLGETTNTATVLLGAPGSGKSALLGEVAEAVAGWGWPVLGIKADVLDAGIRDEAGLQAQLGLEAPPSRLIADLAISGPVLLVIDQLDALASFVDLRTGRLNVLLGLIRRFGRRPNVHLLVSARTFEFNHDVRLRTIEAEQITLALPVWAEVEALLKARDLQPAGWPEDAKDTLRTPQALATFLRLSDEGGREPFENYQALLERLWRERVLADPAGERLARLAGDLAEHMAAEEVLWTSTARFEDRGADLQTLERLEILKTAHGGGAVGFTHQTVFDFVLARAFAAGGIRLADFVQGREGSLFVRPKLWLALNYLRSVEPAAYERELGALWTLPSLRTHLRLMLIEFLGRQAEPTDLERRLLKPLFDAGPDQGFVYRAVAGSPGWFPILAGSGLAAAMGDATTAGLATGVLRSAWGFAPDQVFALIVQNWANDPQHDAATWAVLSEAPAWSEDMIALAERLIQRAPISAFHVEHVANELGVTQPEAAMRLVRARLDRDLSEAVETAQRRLATAPDRPSDTAALFGWMAEHGAAKPLADLLEQTRGWDVVVSLAEAAPDVVLRQLWPWSEAALDAWIDLEPQDPARPYYPLQWELDFDAGADRDRGRNLLVALRTAIETLGSQPEQLGPWIPRLAAHGSALAQRLLAHGLAASQPALAEEAFAFLMGDPRRLLLGSHRDESLTTKRLVSAASPHWTAAQRDAFIAHVQGFRLPALAGPPDPKRKRIRARHARKIRQGVLLALPQAELPPTVQRAVRDEARAIPDPVVGVSEVEADWVDSPMSSEAMAKAGDADILNAFRELPDATGWDNPRHPMRGGNVQLSRAFGAFAAEHPDRAAALARRLTPETGTRAIAYAIRDLGKTADPALVVDLALWADALGFQGEEFRSSVAWGLRELVNREADLGEAAVEMLVRWAEQTPPETAAELDTADEEMEESGEDEVRPALWNNLGAMSLPGGVFPTLDVLVAALLRRKAHARALAILEARLDQADPPETWRPLLQLLPYLREAEPVAREAFLRKLHTRQPDAIGSRAGARLLASADWWAPEAVREILQAWRDGGPAWRRHAYGELIALIALVRPELPWAKEALGDILAGSDFAPRAGAAYTAGNLWPKPERRLAANAILLAVMPRADKAIWRGVLDVFRVAEELPSEPATANLLEAVATHIEAAEAPETLFLLEHLKALLPQQAVTIGRIVGALTRNLGSRLGDVSSSAVSVSPEMVDIAITLHRLGGQTREMGVQLFEALLRLEAYAARDTLQELDNRFGERAVARRPRLPRRPRRGRIARGG